MESDNKKKDSLGKFDELSFDSIECSGEVFKRLAWKDYKGRSIAVIIGSIALSIFFISMEDFVLTLLIPPNIFIAIILSPILGAIIYFNRLSKKAKALFMQEFAERNQLSYKPSIQVDDVVGNLFKVGHSRKITHVLTGSYHGQKARFFYYTYSLGRGRHRRTYRFTITEVFFEKTEFPHILLQAGLIAGRYGKRGENEIKIGLEEEFEKSFDLFARDGYGVEVMQIFSKDFLRFLKEKGSNFSIELKENRIYIYDDVFVKQKKQLQELFEVIGNLFGRIGPLLNRLDNDFAVLHKHYKKER